MGINSCGQLLIDQGNFFNTGLLNWDTTAKTANFTAVNGNGYFVNTTSAAVTVTLPAGSAGDFIGVSDYASTSETNNITISPNGTDKINGINDDYKMNVDGIAVSLLYVDSTRGWKAVASNSENITGEAFITATGGTITTCGNFKIHTFTGPGTFCVSSAGSPANSNVDYLVVAGGGSGGTANNQDAGGGGGAGGARMSSGAASGCYSVSPLGACVSALPVSVQGYSITVGAGGAGSSCSPTNCSPGNRGSNSIFSTITSTGGGSGQQRSSCNSTGPGGSGGGGGRWNTSTTFTGNTPPVSPPQGNNGGLAQGPASRNAGGGGGASAVGGTGSGGAAGDGGDGASNSITGSSVTYSGGGGGGGLTTADGGPGSPGDGGAGGGGAGGGPGSGVAGTANTGGGSGGAGAGPFVVLTSNAGGSGIVIIRYKYQ